MTRRLTRSTRLDRSTRPVGSVNVEGADLTDLALRAARGDRVALDAFVARSLPDVWRYCAHALGPGAADDATQATFLRALGALPRFRGESTARTWLIGVARHTCLDEMRSNGRRRRLQDRLDAEPRHDTVQEPRPHDVERRVAELPADQREAFVLTQLLGFSYGEAAELIDCPVGTIRSRVARARGRLLDQESPASAAAETGTAPEPARIRAVGGRSAR